MAENTERARQAMKEATSTLADYAELPDSLDTSEADSLRAEVFSAFDVFVDELEAAQKERDRFRAGRDWQYDMAKGWRERAVAAEKRVAELEDLHGYSWHAEEKP